MQESRLSVFRLLVSIDPTGAMLMPPQLQQRRKRLQSPDPAPLGDCLVALVHGVDQSDGPRRSGGRRVFTRPASRSKHCWRLRRRAGRAGPQSKEELAANHFPPTRHKAAEISPAAAARWRRTAQRTPGRRPTRACRCLEPVGSNQRFPPWSSIRGYAV